MKTYFYERTAYQLSDQPMPNCFIQLDEHFDRRAVGADHNSTHPHVLLAESICARMADVEMYAFLIEDARKRHSLDKDGDTKAAILTRSFLIGYLGAIRALFDSGAMTLALLYTLPLDRSECSFGHGNFWHQLVAVAPNVYRRYHTLRLFFNELLRWCNETAQRIPPLLVLYNHFGQFSNRELHLKVVDDAHADLTQMATAPVRLNWVDPLQLHDRWKPTLLTLCERLCQDIEACT